MKRKLFGLLTINTLALVCVCALTNISHNFAKANNEYTITLNGSNGKVSGKTNGYTNGTVNAKTALGNDVYFGYQNCMTVAASGKSNYLVQMKKEKEGRFYNIQNPSYSELDNGIKGIKAVTVNYDSSTNLSLYYSNTENDTSGTAISITDGGRYTTNQYYRYFTLVTGNKFAEIESIVIEYSCLDEKADDTSSEEPTPSTPSEEEITVSNVSIVGNLTKTSYVEGENWDLSGLSLQVNYSNATNENLGAIESVEGLSYELSPAMPVVSSTSLRIYNVTYNGNKYNSAEKTFNGITVTEPESSEPSTNETIRFELGQDGASSHVDGSTAKSTYSETVGNYTLSLTSGTNMYPSSRDAKGNGAIKLGSSSKTGGFSFTAPNDVTSVNLEIAKYKSNTSIISLNGKQHTLTKNSNDGQYDVFTIDTSTNKTISLTTVSGGVRAMVNAIEYVVGNSGGGIVPEPEQPEVTLTGITINGDMTQKTYNEGDAWNLAGLSLYGAYSDGSTAKIGDFTQLANNEMFEYEFDPQTATKGTTSVELYALYQDGLELYEAYKTINNIRVNAATEPDPEEPTEGETITGTLTFDNLSKRVSFSTTKQVWEENGITFTNNKNSSTNDVANYVSPVRLYAGSDIIIETSGTISDVIFDCNSSTYATNLKNSIGNSATVNSDKVTVNNLSEKTFTVDSLTAQIRLDALTVTYTTGNGGNTPGGDVGGDDTPTTDAGNYYSPSSYTYRSGMENYNNLEEYGYYDCDSAPSTGNINVLVVPIAFSDSTADTSTVLNDLETVFNGTEQETGWESVSSYFKEASYGKLNLEFTVAPTWYQYNKTKSYMGVDNDGRTNTAVDSAVAWYKDNYNSNCKEFDSDSNGYIDCVFLVYAEKDYQIGTASYDNFWAYTFWTQENNKNRTSPNANTYIWMSYDFMYGDLNGSSHINLDAHTFIHEYGHAMGLDDYYDYGGSECSAGGFDMQDMNVGDHNPFSKMALGWSKPYVVNGDATITIKPASKYENQTIIIPAGGYNSWNKSPFDEYILIEYFTNEGLNQFDIEHNTYTNYPRGTSTPGLRVYHIDARLCYHDGSYYQGYADNVSSSYYYEVAASNTYSGDYQSAFAPNYRLVHLLSQSGTDYMKKGNYMDEYDLFLQGDSFSMTSFKSYFYNSGKLNDGSNLGFTFTVKSINNEGATIQFTKI